MAGLDFVGVLAIELATDLAVAVAIAVNVVDHDVVVVALDAVLLVAPVVVTELVTLVDPVIVGLAVVDPKTVGSSAVAAVQTLRVRHGYHLLQDH